MTELAWKFTLDDGVSGPARKATSALKALNTELRNVSKTQASVATATGGGGGSRGGGGAAAAAFRQAEAADRARTQAAARAEAAANRARAASHRASEAAARQRDRASRSSPTSVMGAETRALERQGSSLRSWAANSLRAHEVAQDAAGGTTLSMAELGGQAGMIAALSAVVLGLAAALTRAALSAGQAVIEMAAFREGTLTALGTVLGGGAGGNSAQSAFRWAGAVARQTPLDERQVVDVMRQAATGGFRDTMLRAVTAAAVDVGSANPNDGSAASRFIVAISQLRGSSKVRAQELNQLREVGIGREPMLRALAHVSGNNQRAGELDPAFLQRIQAMQEHGRFTGAQGAAAALEAVRTVLDNGGPLGTFAKNQSGTLGGVLSNVTSAVFSLVTSINDLEKLPGIRAFKGFLLDIMELVSVGSKGGGAIQSMIVRTINYAGRLFTLFDGKELSGGFNTVLGVFDGIAGAMRYVMPMVESFVKGFGQGFAASLGPLLSLITGMSDSKPGANTSLMAAAFGALGRALGWVTGVVLQFVIGFAAVVAAITGAFGAVFGFVQMLFQLGLIVVKAGLAIGAAIITGMVEGIRGGVTSVREAISEVGHSAIDSAKVVLGIHSPSRVFRDEIGAMIGAGMAAGIGDSAGNVRGALDGILSVPSFAGGFAAGAPSIGSLTIEVHIDGGSGGESIKQQAREGVIEGLAEVFDTLALQGGS